jgi:hypothetical protein
MTDSIDHPKSNTKSKKSQNFLATYLTHDSNTKFMFRFKITDSKDIFFVQMTDLTDDRSIKFK